MRYRKIDLPTDCHISYVSYFYKCKKSDCFVCRNSRGHRYYVAVYYLEKQRRSVYLGKSKESLSYPDTWNTQLINARLSRQWSAKEAAYRVGVSSKTYRMWEQGTHRPQSYPLRKLCSVFEALPSELGFENEET